MKQCLRYRASSSQGFTLVEVLTVIAIIAVLSGIVASAAQSARQGAMQAVDTSNMRQLYVAISLYEEQNGETPPSSLLATVQFVRTSAVYKSPKDNRQPSINGTFPADFSVDQSPLRSQFPISFAYYYSFERYLSSAYGNMSEYRNDPKVGMLASTWYMAPSGLGGSSNEHGPNLGKGLLLRLLMDGSLKRVQAKFGNAYGGSFEQLFLLDHYN